MEIPIAIEAPFHGDILEAIFSHVPLIHLLPARHVSNLWNHAVSTSLRHVNPVKPWLTVHTQNPRAPHVTETYAYDPRSKTWIQLHAPKTNHSKIIKSSPHSTLLYTLSPNEFTFSVDPLHLTWHHAKSPRVWRVDPIVARVGTNIVIVGGACDFEDDPLAVEMYNMETNAWVDCESMPAMLKDSKSLTWLSVTIFDEKIYVTEKNSGITYLFDPATMTWQGQYDIKLEENVFYCMTGRVQNCFVVVGIEGGAEDVKGVKLWEVKEGFGLEELDEMPKEMVEKWKGESGAVGSIEVITMGDYVYIYNPSQPEEIVVCEVMKRGGCEWGSVRNVVVNDGTRMRRMVFCGGDVGVAGLERAVAGNCKFVLKQV